MIRNSTWLVLIPLVLGCGSRGQAPAVYIGHVAPLTGADKSSGQHALNGIRLAVKEFNAEETDGSGITVKVLHVDARPTQEAFEAEAIRLSQINQVVALLGGRTPEEIGGLDQAPVPVVAPGGFYPKKSYSSVMLTGLTPAQKGKALARTAFKDLSRPSRAVSAAAVVGVAAPSAGVGGTVTGAALAAGNLSPAANMVVIVDQRRDEYAVAAEAFVKECASQAGTPRPTLTRWHYRNDKELDELSARLQGARPAAILLAGDVVAVLKLRRHTQTAAVPILFAGPELSPRELLSGGPLAGDVFLATAWTTHVATPASREFVESYQAAFKEEPDIHAAQAYDDARLLFEALRQSEPNTTPMYILDKLKRLTDVATLVGKVSFGADHSLRRPAWVVRLHGSGSVLIRRYEP
jgi:branched-chain amino acid transport system substrate-binding protein